MKNQKKTLKFKKKGHLDKTIQKRKFDRKRKAKDSKKSGQKAAANAIETPSKPAVLAAATPEELNVDDFLEGAFFDADVSASDAETAVPGENDNESEGDGGDEGDVPTDSTFVDAPSDLSGSEAEAEDEIQRHQQQLNDLKTTDPEFYAMLERENKDLLNFQDGGDGEEDDEAAALAEAGLEPTDGKPPKKRSRPKKEASLTDLTLAELAIIRRRVAAKSLRALRHALRLFRAACHLADDPKEGAIDTREDSIHVASSKVFARLVRFCVRQLPGALLAHLEPIGKEGIKQNPKFAKLEAPVRAFLGNLVHLLNHSQADKAMISFLLVSVSRAMPLFAGFPKLATRFLKALLQVWAQAPDDGPQKIDSFLRIRELVLAMPDRSKLLETALKGIYLTYVRNAKFTSATNLPGIIFKANCVVELYGLDWASSYQHAFVYIRQLAIHLRNALQTKTKEACRSVYNWQFVNCIRVWTMLLAAHATTTDAPLYPLVYPLVQVCTGVLELVGSPRFFPLRFTVLRMLDKVSASCGVYVPLASYVLAVLDHISDDHRVGKAPNLQNLLTILKVSSAVADTKQYKDAVLKEGLSVLHTHLASLSYSISFPELVLPIKLQLKKVTSRTKRNVKAQKQIKAFLDKLDRNVEFVSRLRVHVTQSPQDLLASGGMSALTTFKQQSHAKGVKSPLEQYLDSERADKTAIEAEPAKEESNDPKPKKSKAKQAVVEELSDNEHDVEPLADDLVQELVLSDSDSNTDDAAQAK